jgi:hypothetical protein
MPWWGLFWPYRVQLQDIKVDHAKVLWKLADKESGIYDTFLEVTPNGHDFEYDARGGIFTTPSTPALQIQHIHLLVRRPRLYCDELVLGDDSAHPEETLRVHGDAGLQEDHTIKASATLDSLNVEPWLPTSQRGHIQGHASGYFEYLSTGTGLDTASGDGHVHVDGATLHDLAALHQYAKLTGSPDPGDVPLSICQTDLSLKEGAISLENIDVEAAGIFHVTGSVKEAKDKSLSGTLEVGLTDPYLRWLPTARSAIFDHRVGDYNFATVRVYGTTRKPEQDLTPRILHEVEKSPTTALKLFFNEAGGLFESN